MYQPTDSNATASRTGHYQPKTNDYVKYDHLEGWIYWIDEQKRYLTIEIMVREKTEQSYKDCSIHTVSYTHLTLPTICSV